MGETEVRGNIMQGDGVYKSTDDGRTWAHIGLENTQAIARIRIHPTNPDIVYVAALGHPYGKNPERGVFRSKDGGKSWEKILYKSDKAGAIDLTLDPHDPNTLYASIWEVNRTPWGLTSGGPDSGLYKSTDGGDHWTEITRNPGLPKGIVGKITISVSGADSNRLYSMVENADGGLYVSDDAGASWRKVSDNHDIKQRAFYFSRVYADPKAKDTVYALNVGMWKSTDGGKTFRQVRTSHSDNHDLWIDPNNTARMVESNDGGANVTNNGGQSWTNLEFPTAQLYHVAVTNELPYHVCGAQQDSSTICVSSAGAGGRGGGSGRGGAPTYSAGGGESGYIAPDPVNPNIFYAGSQGALLTRFDRRTNYSRDVQVYPLFFSGENAGSLPERWQWTYPIVFSPKNPTVLYTSSQHLWKTTDEGHSWQKISPDLTRNDPATLGDSGGPITHDQNGPEIYGTIFAIAPSHKEENTIWTGSDDGLIQITRDGGKTWTNVTPPGMPHYGRVSIIEASPNDAATAYAAVKNYQMDDRNPYMYRTHDYGKTWTKIINGIPAGDYVHSIREDTVRKSMLFAGTEHGIYISFDDGDNWQSIRLNLPDTQVSDIVIANNQDVVIATHGRSFYILDDIAPLRQFTPNLTSENVHLFTASPAVKNVGQAHIDYYLAKPAEKITIDILDDKGQVIRTFTGAPNAGGGRGGRGGRGAAAAAADPNAADDAAAGGGGGGGRRGGGNQPAPDRTGVNRFTWDMRYPGATTFTGMVLWGANTQGPAAVPGSYTVRLTADGQTLTGRIMVEKDPRLDSVTVADLKQQFDLALKVRDEVTACDEMVIVVREFKRQMDDRLKAANNDAAIKSAFDAFRAKLTEVEEDVYQVQNQANEDPLNFPIKLNNKIAALGSSIEHGDGKPTAASFEVFNLLTQRLKAEQAKFDQVLSGLPAINKLLTDRKLQPLVKTTVETPVARPTEN